MDEKVFDRNVEAKKKNLTDLDWPVKPIRL